MAGGRCLSARYPELHVPGGIRHGNVQRLWSAFLELFPTVIRNTAMGSAFNLARGIQFFTPVIIAVIAERYGLGGGISLAALFAMLTGAWVWMLPETKGIKLAVLHEKAAGK